MEHCEIQGQSYWRRGWEGMGGGAALPIFSLLVHFPNINSAPQHCIGDKTQGKCYLLTNWASTKNAYT